MDSRAKFLPRTEISDLKRQMSFNEAMKKRVYENADRKVATYESKNQALAEKIRRLEDESTQLQKEEK